MDNTAARLRKYFVDQESLWIFDHLVAYSEIPKITVMDDMVFKLSTIMNGDSYRRILEDAGSVEPIVIFGAGKRGAEVYQKVIDRGGGVFAFCDNNERKQQETYMDLPVVSVAQLVELFKECNVVVALNEHSSSVIKQLLRCGVDAEKIIGCFRTPYFEDFLPLGESEFFVDAGCFDGSTSKDFLEWAGDRAKGVLAFEPDEKNFCRCQDTLSRAGLAYSRVVNKLLWSENMCLPFLNTGDGMSRVGEGGSSVETTTLDSELENLPATYMKFDIEGGELEALKGGSSFIKKNRPKLAVSVYHKPDDIYKIPEYLLSLVDGYKLYLRHYTLFQAETVLFAI